MTGEHRIKARVLLVDDEVCFSQPLAKRLARRVTTVETAHSGEAALDLLGERMDANGACGVDVVVLDMKMPGMDGMQTLTAIRECFVDVEVIMLTGHTSLDGAVEGMKLGALHYLMKPCELGELLAKIDDAWRCRVKGDACRAGAGLDDKDTQGTQGAQGAQG